MESTIFAEKLMEFGLTRQEASIYECLLEEGKTTGYEVAKLIGISRSNAYNSLASMTEKGAAYLAEENTIRKYVPVDLKEFCKNRIRRLEENKKWLCEHKPEEKDYTEGYITIEGAHNILDKMRNLLSNAKDHVIISCTRNYLLLMVEELEQLIRMRRKVVIITDQPITFDRAKVYLGNARETAVGLIVDSKYVLAGEYGEGSADNCLYSGQKNFVKLYKTALSNEIRLLAMPKENRQS